MMTSLSSQKWLWGDAASGAPDALSTVLTGGGEPAGGLLAVLLVGLDEDRAAAGRAGGDAGGS
jgi:hypothetical protein